MRWRKRASVTTERYELQYTAKKIAKRTAAVGTLIAMAMTSSSLLPPGAAGGGCTGAFTVGGCGDAGEGKGAGS